jgi:hypothetical protein
MEQLNRMRLSLASSSKQEREVIDLFHRHPGINGAWDPASAEEGACVNDYRHIDVQPSCMTCHGSKDSRPAFIKNKYGDNDRAFNFKPANPREYTPCSFLKRLPPEGLPSLRAAPARSAPRGIERLTPWHHP